MSASAKKRAKPARGQAIGILNPWGDLWTYETFRTEAEARQHVEDFWRGNSGGGDLSRFKIVPVKVTVSALPHAADPEKQA